MMNKQLLLMAITLLNIYAGAQAAAHNASDAKERAQAEVATFRSVAELEKEKSRLVAEIQKQNLEWRNSVTPKEGCELCALINKRLFALTVRKPQIATESEEVI